MRELVALAILALACGAVAYQPTACTRPGAPAREARAVGAATSTVPDADFDGLASRGSVVAPGMREVSRRESSGERIEIAQATTRDTCVRVAFEATAPVVARLMDGEGNVLASSDRAAKDGVLGVGGPVCVRKGDAVSAVAEGASPSVRWVAWESP